MIPHKGENVPVMEFSIYFAILAELDGILQTILRMTSSLAVYKNPDGRWGCVFLCLHNWYWLLCEMEWWHTGPGVNMGCVQQYYGELIELYRVEHDRLSR